MPPSPTAVAQRLTEPEAYVASGKIPGRLVSIGPGERCSACRVVPYSPFVKVSRSAWAGVTNFAPNRNACSCALQVKFPPLMPVGKPMKFSSHDEAPAWLPGAELSTAYDPKRLRGLPEGRDAMGTLARVQDVLACRLLRFITQVTRDQALPRDAPSGDAFG